jgi:hypothetical protein
MQATISVPKRVRIDARQAASAAAAYFRELYSNVASFSLEEVEFSEHENCWMITLSFEIPPSQGLSAALIPFQPPKTKFKVFKVDARTGKVIAMKIRKLE